MLTGARRYTDSSRRRRDRGLSAEIQWELLPVLAYELPRFSIAGGLEPAYDIGGDTFDYAVSAQQLTVSITNAVGHGLRAAMTPAEWLVGRRWRLCRLAISLAAEAHTLGPDETMTDQASSSERIGR